MQTKPQLDHNRSALIDYLQKTIKENLSYNPAKQLALLTIELYNLKTLEAQYGHQAARIMISKAKSLLRKVLRENDKLSQLDNKRFVIILQPVFNIEHCSLAIQRILKIFSDCAEIQKRCHRTNIRIGLAIAPLHSQQADRLLNFAESALDQANLLKTSHYIYDQELTTQLVNQAILEEEMLTSIKNDELSIVYQPQYNLSAGYMSGVEALLRWRNKNHGNVSPELFIPIAENTHFIAALSEWVFNTVLRQCRPIIEKRPDFTISINASIPLLDNDYFVDFIERSTSLWGFPRSQLIIEITESIMMRTPERVSATLNHLRALKVKLAIDDFGTGFSSFYYLQRLPLQELKIDKSFIIGLKQQGENWKIVQSIVDLANRFDLEIVAEGIETHDTLQLMKSLKVDRAQGFLIGKPMEFQQLLSELDNNLYNLKLLQSN